MYFQEVGIDEHGNYEACSVKTSVKTAKGEFEDGHGQERENVIG